MGTTEISVDRAFYIFPDNIGVAPILRRHLQRCSVKAHITDTVLPEMQNIIFLPGINSFAEELEPASSLAINGQLFDVAHQIARQSSPSGVFIAVQNTGGYFGCKNIQNPWRAGIGALVKTAAREWPAAKVKVVDIDCQNRDSEKIARDIYQEIIAGGPEIEVAIGKEGRFTVTTLSEEQYQSPPIPVAEGSVVVVSGGARGVTPHCLLALAKVFKIKIAILGRTALEQEPANLQNCNNEKELQKAIIAQLKQQQQQLTPVVVQNEIKKILAIREIQSNIQKLEKAGAEVSYHEVDVVDLKSVEETLAKTRKQWGAIQIVIHAAGIIADKHIHKKTTRQFQKVFDAKVEGFKNLLSATKEDPLSHICCFSSIAARTGNVGQVDYAMANEILNKVCQQQKLQRPDVAVTSINWGPWQGGMVTPELASHFENQGIDLIPLQQGAEVFVTELQNSQQVEVVIGPHLPKTSDCQKQGSQIWVHESTYPLLNSHKIQGKPVIPVVLVHEWCLRFARVMYPEKTAVIRDLKVMKGIVVEDLGGRGEWLAIDVVRGKGERIDFMLRVGKVLHYQATITHAEKPQFPALPALPPLETWNIAADIYGKTLFHGPDFAVIEELTGIAPGVCTAKLKARDAFSEWQSNIPLIDGGLQLALLYLLERYRQPALPTAIDFISLRECSTFAGEIFCIAQCTTDTPLSSVWNIFYVKDNTIVGEIRGLSIHAVPSNFA